MFIIIRPDCIGRAPTISFHENVTPDEKIYLTQEKEYVVEEFDSILMLKHILLKCMWTANHVIRKIGKDNLPTDTWYLESLNTTYVIENDKVGCTQLFKSWGLEKVLKMNDKGELELI